MAHFMFVTLSSYGPNFIPFVVIYFRNDSVFMGILRICFCFCFLYSSYRLYSCAAHTLPKRVQHTKLIQILIKLS